MPSTRYRAGIIGCGRIAGKLEDDPLREHPCTHAGIYSSSSKIELAACCCPDINRAAEFADKWKMPAWYVSSEEMFAKEKLDIVSICTPASFHADMTIQAAQAGVKAVFCEKPMALSLEEADRMLECCHKNRVLLTINHLRRWGWDYQAVKKLIEEGEIGKVQTVTGTYSGKMMHTGTHLFDILHFLFGEIESVQAGRMESAPSCLEDRKHPPQAEDKENDPDLSGVLHFDNGTGVFVNGLRKGYFIFELDVFGSKGRIKIGNHLLELWKPGSSRHYQGFIDLQLQPFPFPSQRPNPWLAALKDILDSLETGRKTLSTGEDARRAMETGFALFLSAQGNGNKVSLPLCNPGGLTRISHRVSS